MFETIQETLTLKTTNSVDILLDCVDVMNEDIPLLAAAAIWVALRDTARCSLPNGELERILSHARECLDALPPEGYDYILRLTDIGQDENKTVEHEEESELAADRRRRREIRICIASALCNDLRFFSPFRCLIADDGVPFSSSESGIGIIYLAFAETTERELPLWRSLQERSQWCEIATVAVEDTLVHENEPEESRSMIPFLKKCLWTIQTELEEQSCTVEHTVIRLVRCITWSIGVTWSEDILTYVLVCAELHACITAFVLGKRPTHFPRFFPKLDRVVDRLVLDRVRSSSCNTIGTNDQEKGINGKAKEKQASS
jgi:hypothetical protein